MKAFRDLLYFRVRKVKDACTFPWLLAIVRSQWADFGRAGELARARKSVRTREVFDRIRVEDAELLDALTDRVRER